MAGKKHGAIKDIVEVYQFTRSRILSGAVNAAVMAAVGPNLIGSALCGR
jgi:hypothetical protein